MTNHFRISPEGKRHKFRNHNPDAHPEGLRLMERLMASPFRVSDLSDVSGYSVQQIVRSWKTGPNKVRNHGRFSPETVYRIRILHDAMDQLESKNEG